MNKTIVKIFALMLAVVLLAVPVFAGGDQPNLPDEHEQDAVVAPVKMEAQTTNIRKTVEINNEIPLRSFHCSYCNAEMQHYNTMVGEWETVYFAPCQLGYTEHTDVCQEKVTIIKYKCTNSDCDIVDTEYYTETRQYCR